MESAFGELAKLAPPSGLLGYLNFSDGRPDAKFHRNLNEAYRFLAEAGEAAPWHGIKRWLTEQATTLEATGSSAFKDLTQARAVVRLAFDRVPLAYREFHSDLLAHQSERTLFTPFFLARVCEAVLAQGGPWDEDARIIDGTLGRLNDFVGHRPVAVLETKAAVDYYPHEKVRPVPLFIRGSGVGYGPYGEILEQAIALLKDVPEEIAREADFSLERLDELAMDPRPYDHTHPVNRRPNYLFGEWDPHCIDNAGYFRRFIVRQNILDALVRWLSEGDRDAGRLFEASAVLAGTILMASGISGEGPSAHDSDTKLANLVPANARYRDAFYNQLLAKQTGDFAARLKEESQRLRQPFGGIRQHLNQTLARERAAQLQDRELALLFADMGYPRVSRDYASRIPTASIRILGEVRIRQTSLDFQLRQGKLSGAHLLVSEIEDLIRRGIDCGALPDPWNILGFQGLFPLFQAREDSVFDTRHEELIDIVQRQFTLYAQALAQSAAKGDTSLQAMFGRGVKKFAGWWDQFATAEVSDLPAVRGGDRAEAALHVASALALWAEERRQTSHFDPTKNTQNALRFWQTQRERFTSPSAFAQVIDALIRQEDWRASMGLMMTWLNDADTLPLNEADPTFYALTARWIDGVLQLQPGERNALMERFFELMEANAADYWNVPDMGVMEIRKPKDETYNAAYEEMSYQDSTDDRDDGGILGNEADEFGLEQYRVPFERRLAFLKTAGEFLVKVIPHHHGATWLDTAWYWKKKLEELLEILNDIQISAPAGGVEDLIEFDRRKAERDHLIDIVIDTTVAVGEAVRLLQAMDAPDDPLSTCLVSSSPKAVRKALPRLLEDLSGEPLLFIPLVEGGHPKQILRAKLNLQLLETLLDRTPRLGLVRETYHLVQVARSMEQNSPPEGRKISEFDRLFRMGLKSVAETLLDAAPQWEAEGTLSAARNASQLLRKVADSFLQLWIAHSQTLRLSAIEGVDDWSALRDFIKAYGREIFTPAFMNHANLRGLLQRGVENWLEGLAENPGDPHPEKLLNDIERNKVSRRRAALHLEAVLQAVTEHFDEFRDYNTTTTQSDYGENLHVLMDFLRLKVNYERYAWRMRPLLIAHEALCRRGMTEYADQWRDNIADFTKPLADDLLKDLARLESEHVIRLRTVRDKLEERFLLPLRLDELAALVGACVAEAADDLANKKAIDLFLEKMHPLAERPSGVGLDPPEWIERLRMEVRDCRDHPRGKYVRTPLVPLSLADLQRQLADWDKPID